MRHAVRKIETNRTTPFDDRWWPVAVALLALGGTVLAGIRLTRPAAPLAGQGPLDFWSQLTVAVTLGAVCAAAWIRPQGGRRRLLLSLALSLILNAGLLGVLSWMELVRPAWEPPVTAEEPEPEPDLPVPAVPEYFPLATEGRDRPRQELQRPVPTGKPEMQQEQWLSKSSLAADLQRPPQPDASREVPSPLPPLSKPRPERVESAPREFDLQGQISRQTLADRPRSAQPLVDTGAVAQQPTAVTVAAPPAELQRQRYEAALRAIDLEPAQRPPSAGVVAAAWSKAAGPATDARFATGAAPSTGSARHPAADTRLRSRSPCRVAADRSRGFHFGQYRVAAASVHVTRDSVP